MSASLLACMATAAAFYHLPPRVLPSIQRVEGGQIGTVHTNPNGTADLGLMQVNTIWVQPLAKVAHLSPEKVTYRLTYDACFNVAAAAAILNAYVNEAHGNLMVAIGYYHSHTPMLSEAYKARVISAAQALFAHR